MNMTRILLKGGFFLCLLAHSLSGRSQVLPNYGFENVTCPVNSVYNSVTTCVPGWSASHGVPHVDTRSSTTGTTTNVVHMYHQWDSGNNRTNGIFASCNFPGGNSAYALSLDVAHDYTNGYGNNSSVAPQVDISLTTNLQPFTTTSGASDPEPTNVNVVWTQRVALPYYGSWTTLTVNVVPPTGGVYQVWIRPASTATIYNGYSNGNYPPGIYVDNVKFAPCSAGNLYLQNATALPATVATNASIFVGSAVTSGTQGPVAVQPSQTVALRAGQEISLLNEFRAEAGSEFSALVLSNPCPPGGGTSRMAASGTAALQAASHAAPAKTERAEMVGASPNPANTFLNLPAGLDATQLYKASGEPVLLPASIANTVNVQALPEGLYLLRMTKDGVTTSQRIQIVH